MKRVGFWLRQGGSALVGGIGMGLFVMLIIALQDETFTVSAEMVSLYMFIGTAYMLLIMMIMAYKAQLPLTMALGATRKSCFWGLQIMRWIPVLAVPVIAGLLGWLFPESRELLLPMLPVFAAVSLLAASLGSFSGLAFCRFGKLGAIVIVLIIVIGAMAMGAAFGLLGSGYLVSLPDGWQLSGICGAAALLVYAVDLALEWLVLKIYEVKL